MLTKRREGARSGAISPDKALANTRALLEAKQQKARQPPPYPVDDPVHHGHGPQASPEAAQAAQQRHLEEANSPAIHGQMASQDRAAQIRRDRD